MGSKKKYAQGSQLPPDGSPLSSYPIGSCVLIDVNGYHGWHLIAFRIGGYGNPHVRIMAHPPSSQDWNSKTGQAREVDDGIIVLRSAWPHRATDSRGLDANSDPDPVIGNLRADDNVGERSDLGDPIQS